MTDPVSLVHLDQLKAASKGSRQVGIGIIDGPVDWSHPDFREAGPTMHLATGACRIQESFACRHGTFVSGVLAASRDSVAPGLCPGCRFVVRPVFAEAGALARTPQASPDELAHAIEEVVAQGARLINLSLELRQAGQGRRGEARLRQAFEMAFQRGVLLIAASGNQGKVGRTPFLDHPWVIPVAACHPPGILSRGSNIGLRIGQRGVMAPGSGVISLAPGGGYARLEGTSVAAPFVTAALALLWSLFPQASAAMVRESILPPRKGRTSVVPPLMDAQAAWFRLAQLAR